MKKVSIFLAEGFEEVEALTQVDLLRRAGAEVTMVSISGAREVAGSHGIVVTADKIFAEMDFAEMDLLVLPGGMPGTLHLKECAPLIALLQDFNEKGRKLAAICAAGLLRGKKAACYPGCEDGLTGAEVLTDRVVVDGNITTSRGVGTAIPFALSLIAQLYDQQKADQIRESIVYGHGPAKA